MCDTSGTVNDPIVLKNEKEKGNEIKGGPIKIT
jgi:hypothetical protein